MPNGELNIYATEFGENSLSLGGVKKVNFINATSIPSNALSIGSSTISFDKVVTISDNALQSANGATIMLPNTCTSVGAFRSANNLTVYGYRNYDSIDTLVAAHKATFINYNDLYDMTNKTVELSTTEEFYTGKAIQPQVKVTHKVNNKVIDVPASAYDVTYQNNIDMTTQAKVIVTGKAPYNGSVTKTFSILGNMADAEVNLAETEYDADGTAHEPAVKVYLYGEQLIQGVDYNVAYQNNVRAGRASVIVSSMNNLMRGSKTTYFYINSFDISDATVTLDNAIFSYDGSEKKPTPTVVLGSKTLRNGTDYTVTYQDNIKIGQGKVIVIGTGNYSGTAAVSFQIIKGDQNVYEQGETLVSSDFNYTITSENEVEFISSNVNMKEVVIPATVTAEDGTIFTVTSIGDKAFYKNSTLTNVVVPNTVTSIENNAFYGCKNLKKVKIGDGLEVVGANSFRKCTKLEEISLPKSIDEIGKGAFYGCKNLKKVNIKSDKVVDIGANAFKSASEKLTINVPNKLVKKYQRKLTSKKGFKKTMKIK